MGFKLYSEEFKKKVVDAYKSGMMIKEVADMYNVSKSSVSCWVKGIKPYERKLFTVEQKKEFVKYRIKNNIPYDEMAEKIGIIQDTLRNWESTYFFAVMEEIDREKKRKSKNIERKHTTEPGTLQEQAVTGHKNISRQLIFLPDDSKKLLTIYLINIEH